MALLKPADRRFLEALSDLSYCNQFLPERVDLERRALGKEFDEKESVWSLQHEVDGDRANVQRINARVESLAESIQKRLAAGTAAEERELILYEDLIQYLLYYRFRESLNRVIKINGGSGASKVSCWKKFVDAFNHFLSLSACPLPSRLNAARMFADLFQVRRAFDHIFQFIIGRSMPTAQLRASVWQSIFTHNMRRYRRSMFDKMADFTTLIAGPSGTGKELVASAIGLSRYIPFDEKTERFAEEFDHSFHALNLSALSPNLIESELFGHCRGAYTGAVSDREGWLEVCSPLGTVFLDEIGELDPAIQVKLLRVLQTRTFQRLGESTPRPFRGKIIAATNRDLAEEMRAGRFREDFYYRLCSDTIQTPALREQLADSPDDLHDLVLYIATRLAPDEATAIADEVEKWIEKHLGRDYEWKGNIRELEQCVRNVMIRNHYTPPKSNADASASDPRRQLTEAIESGSLSAEELLQQYCTIVYANVGSYEQTAKKLGIDRRTVKARIDPELLARIKGRSINP